MDEDAILSMMRALLEAQEKGLANAHGMEPLDGNYAHANHSGYGDGYNAWEPTGEHVSHRSYTYHEAAYAQEHNSGYDAGYNSWEPTSNHGFDTSSTYHEGPLDGSYAPAHQSEYDAGCHSWEPPCGHGFDGSAYSQGGLYDQPNQSGYEEAYPPWDMQYAHGDNNCSSSISINEETYNMMKMLLDEQTKTHELINSITFSIPSIPPSQSAAATAPVESFTTNLTPCIEEDDSDCLSFHETEPTEIPPTEMGYGFEEIAPQTEDFQDEANWATIESDFLLGYGGDELLELRNEEQVDHAEPLSNSPMENVVSEDACPGSLVVECNEDTLGEDHLQVPDWSVPTFEDIVGCTVEQPMQSYDDLLLLYATIGRSYEGKVAHAKPLSCSPILPLPATEVIHMPPVYKMDNKEARTEVTSPPGQDTGIPLRLPSPKATIHDLGSLPTTEAPHGHQWTLPYEEIRMKEFRGWFYAEYEPGDPQSRRVTLDKSQA